MLRRIVVRDHQEAYDRWARDFDDPALMANRDAAMTRFKVANIARDLPLGPGSRVLDVGPGDGALVRLIAPTVESCCGVDPSESAVRRLGRLFEDLPNVAFVCGTSDAIPYAEDEFDVVVMNSVMMILPSREVAERTVTELVRVCRPGGTIYIGEVPFRDELEHGLLSHLARRLRDLGAVGLTRSLYRLYLRPVLRGEPIVILPVAPGSTLHFSPADFEATCRRNGAHVRSRRHREPRRDSTTRNDYILALPPSERREALFPSDQEEIA